MTFVTERSMARRAAHKGSRMAERVEIQGVQAEVARSFCARARGLIGRRNLPVGEGLLILRCNAIHTFFMRFPIDATFLDGEDRIVKVVRNIRPWNPFVWGGWRARKVLETAAQPVRPQSESV